MPLQTIEINNDFSLAVEIVFETQKNLFLTGKAGTGKTTFLKYIKQHGKKNTVITAPTGVAAINAGGVTLHSFFQLPFVTFIKNGSSGWGNQNSSTIDIHTFFATVRFQKSKIELYKELELLIIDEVSMLRCDMLDCIDVILQHFRKNSQPFGGVQVLFIGDLYQLPPVVKENDVLLQYYKSPFFFESEAYKNAQFCFVELQTVYRQQDQTFIDLLNNIRYNTCTTADLNTLQNLPKTSDFDDFDNYVTLTTHNWKADRINQSNLQKINSDAYSFKALIEGDFPESMYPIPLETTFKVGAQVMFIKNDSDKEKRYFNGKLALIKSIDDKDITVWFSQEKKSLVVPLEKWKNVRYELNNETNKIEEKEIGSFTHLPIRLAWSVTIHKSQGLTFDKLIIDASDAFAPGQVYVAMSRCRTLKGIVLQSHIYPSAIQPNMQVEHFLSSLNTQVQTKESLLIAKKEYTNYLILQTFEWEKMMNASTAMLEIISTKNIPEKSKILALALNIKAANNSLQQTINNFVPKLQKLIEAQSEVELLDLLSRALYYFGNQIITQLIEPLQNHINEYKKQPKLKSYIKELKEIETTYILKYKLLINLKYNDIKILQESNDIAPVVAPSATKPIKGETFQITLNEYKKGKTIEEIAAVRQLAIGTIESHLEKFVKDGILPVENFITPAEIETVNKIYISLQNATTIQLKEKLPNLSFSKIRLALLQLQKVNK